MANASIIQQFEDIFDPFCEVDHTKFTTDKLVLFSIYLILQNILPANPQLIDDSLLQNLLSKAREIGKRIPPRSLPNNFLYPPQRNRPFPSSRPYSPREWASRFNDSLSYIAKVDDPAMGKDLRGVEPPALPYQPDYSNSFNCYLARGQWKAAVFF